MPDRHAMAEAHEKFLAELNGGVKSRGSGSQWHDKADGRSDHLDVPFAFCWDGKATLGESVSVTRKMWDKITEEAHGERPQLGLRFYDSERLDVGIDLITILAADYGELLEMARAAAGGFTIKPDAWEQLSEDDIEELRKGIEDVIAQGGQMQLVKAPASEAELRSQLAALRRERAGHVAEIERLKEALAAAAPPESPRQLGPAVIPSLPWTVVHKRTLPQGRSSFAGTFYDAQGHSHSMTVASVRVEPTGSDRSRLMVNDQVVRAGELWIDGRLNVKVGG